MKIKDVLDLCAYRQIMFCGVSIRQYFKPYGTVWKGSRMIDDLDEANYIFYLHALSRDVDCKTCTNSISSLTNQNSQRDNEYVCFTELHRLFHRPIRNHGEKLYRKSFGIDDYIGPCLHPSVGHHLRHLGATFYTESSAKNGKENRTLINNKGSTFYFSLVPSLTMVPPFGFLRIFVTRLHINTVVRWSSLLSTAAQHRRYTKTH